MKPWPRCTPRTQAALGLALCVLLAWPPVGHFRLFGEVAAPAR